MSALSIFFLAAAVASPGPIPASTAPSPEPSGSVTPATPLPQLSPVGTPAPVPSGSASPAASPAPGPVVSATPPVPAASPVPAPAPSATLVPSPMPYNYRFVPRQPEHPAAGQPQIFAVFLNEKKLRSHGPINIKVETNPEVVKVVSRSNGREGAIPRVAPGEFEVTSILPTIPFIAAGMTVDLEFTATGADGRKATVRVPVRLD